MKLDQTISVNRLDQVNIIIEIKPSEDWGSFFRQYPYGIFIK
jgi:hypothetical protein